MSKQVLANVHFLSLLISCEEDQKIALLKTMNDKQFQLLVECFLNVLCGVFPLSQSDKKKLMRYKNIIRKITDRETTRIQRKKLLLKYRNIISIIVKPILDTISK